MPLSRKVKIALDETRTLMLGAQILLGFQFNGAFQERFNSLPFQAKIISAVALLFMLGSVGLLIVPSAFHRLVDRGESSGRTLVIASLCAAASLLPFAVALGIDLALTLMSAAQNTVLSLVAGTSFAVMGVAAWYGLGWIMKRHHGIAERRQAESDRDVVETAPLHSRIEQMLTEARVILPGAQALLGFQLVAVLTDTFNRLPSLSRLLHAAALMSVALSVALLITPAALHRIVWAGEDTEAVLRIGGRITIVALLPLAVGIAADTFVVLSHVLGSMGSAAVTALLALLCLFGLWFGWPIVERLQRRSGFMSKKALDS
jgi:hypothetical protein